MSALNIVELIENNPITKLSNTYNGKLLCKLKNEFSDEEQQLFVSSFYCYLNYDKFRDFVIDFDIVWKWLGFTLKTSARELLLKHFTNETDFIYDKQDTEQKKHGGHNKQTILLSIKTFKSFCMKAQTQKAKKIHDYYLKMEEIIHDIVEEESDELKQQLAQKDHQITQIQETTKHQITQIQETTKQEIAKSQKHTEQVLIGQFPVNTECIYFGTTNNLSINGEKLVKFGQTNDLRSRVHQHKGKYDNFQLVNAFRVQNKVEMENLIKSYPKIKKYIRDTVIDGTTYKEMIAYDETTMTLDKIAFHFKTVIDAKQYSVDNYNALLKQNTELANEVASLTTNIKELSETITARDIRILEMTEIIAKHERSIAIAQEETKSPFVMEPEDDLTKKFKQFIGELCIINPEVEETSVSLEGQYRLWSQTKPTKEVFHAFKQYMDTRFRQQRIMRNGQMAHGYIGVKLKPLEYKRTDNSQVETFLFEVCRFSPTGKILNSVCLDEFQKWKKSIGAEINGDEMKELKQYLKKSPYALNATIWADGTSNEGYYGFGLRTEDDRVARAITTTGKKVEKRDVKTNAVLNTWNTIANAAIAENISTAKMSRSVKNKVIFTTDDGEEYLYA